MRAHAGRGGAEQARLLAVTGKRRAADRLAELVCEPADGAALPRWAPGAHVDLAAGGGPALARPYSLCGDPDDTGRWRFLVRRRPGADGGVSAYLHDRLEAGDTVAARGPRDRFPLAAAARYLFLASGAGVAPLLPMVARVRAARVYPWSLVLLDRGAAAGPLHDEITALGPEASVTGHFAAVAAAVAAAAPGTAVQVAGGSRFVTAVETEAGRRAGLGLHRQRFDNPAASEASAGGACELVLARTGGRVSVAPGTPLLKALLEAGVPVPWACGSGICGACVLPVTGGKIRHRDAVLTPAERAAGRQVVTCVSAAASPVLVLDI